MEMVRNIRFIRCTDFYGNGTPDSRFQTAGPAFWHETGKHGELSVSCRTSVAAGRVVGALSWVLSLGWNAIATRDMIVAVGTTRSSFAVFPQVPKKH